MTTALSNSNHPDTRMRLLAPPSTRQTDIGIAILRIVIGAVFVAHGGQKLFVFGFDGLAGAFGQMGIPLPGLVGPAVALVELFAGLALIAGLLTRLAAFGLGVTMLGALFIAHLAAGFFLPAGFEYVLTLLGATATLMLTGAGSYSLDAKLAERRPANDVTVRRMRRAA